MNSETSNSTKFYLAFILAIWFLLTSAAWSYWMNLLISYPFGLLALFMWWQHKSEQRYKWVFYILVLGAISSVTFLAFFLWRG